MADIQNTTAFVCEPVALAKIQKATGYVCYACVCLPVISADIRKTSVYVCHACAYVWHACVYVRCAQVNQKFWLTLR